MDKKREIYSDVLKIVSIFMVILIHILSPYREMYYSQNGKFFLLLSITDDFTRVAVPIFFMITGTFMLSKTTEKYSTYFKERVLKLLIPLLIASLFYYLYSNIKGGGYISIVNFVRYFTNDTIQYHLWFMYAIIMVYLLIPYLQILVQDLDRKKLLNLIVLLAIVSNGFNTINLFTARYGHELLKGFVLPDIFAYINYLFIGYYISKIELNKKKRIILSIIFIVSMCAMFFANRLFAINGPDDKMILSTSIFPILPAVSVYLFVKDWFKNRKVPKVLSSIIFKMSSCVFYLYLVHAFLLDRIRFDLFKNWTCKNAYEDLLKIIVVAITVFISSFIVAYIIVTIKDLIKKIIIKKQEKK